MPQKVDIIVPLAVVCVGELLKGSSPLRITDNIVLTTDTRITCAELRANFEEQFMFLTGASFCAPRYNLPVSL